MQFQILVQVGVIRNKSKLVTSAFLCSVQFSSSYASNSLQPHRLQHTRPPFLSPTPKACSNSCPSSQWCHSTISSSVVPFSSCLPSFPASGSFPMSLFFPWGGQRIGASASASVLPVNIQDWFPLELTGLTYWVITKINNWELILLPLTILFTSVLSLCLVYYFEALNFWNKCILNLKRFNYRYLSSLPIGV